MACKKTVCIVHSFQKVVSIHSIDRRVRVSLTAAGTMGRSRPKRMKPREKRIMPVPSVMPPSAWSMQSSSMRGGTSIGKTESCCILQDCPAWLRGPQHQGTVLQGTYTNAAHLGTGGWGQLLAPALPTGSRCSPRHAAASPGGSAPVTHIHGSYDGGLMRRLLTSRFAAGRAVFEQSDVHAASMTLAARGNQHAAAAWTRSRVYVSVGGTPG